MTNPIPYDGTGKLGDALAALHGISPNNHNKIAQLIGEAKADLNIDSKARRFPDDVKLAIYRWHYDRLNPVTDVETISQEEAVEILSQPEAVETFSQPAHDDTVEINSHYGFNDLVRVAFYTTSGGIKKRQVVALDGFYINALMLAAGIGKADVPKWVQHAVDNWPAFDPLLPITKQVKRLIIRELTEAIVKREGAYEAEANN
jgi:hypothetical protein